MPFALSEPGAGPVLVEDLSRQPGQFELRVLYPNQDFAVRRALASVMEGLAGLGLSEAAAGSVELVLAEVLNNVAEHAYGNNATGLVELTVRRIGSHLRFDVIDEGHPMPGYCLPEGCCPHHDGIDVQGPAEGGYGWFLIRTLADRIEYARRGGCNRLRFEMRFARRLRGS